MAETVRGAVAKRDNDQPDNNPIKQVEKNIRSSRQWFDSVAPAHVDADQFISLCLGVIRKGDVQLKKALVQAPYSFMRAASECARLGLVPGDTYHFVAFKNSKENIYEVTGIVDYKGEIDQIYRAGGVTAVHVHTVRANDKFVWRPGQMDLPFHEIAANDEGQIGLGGYDARGPLTGVYAYGTMVGGGYSQPVVLGLSEIARHRRFAKTDKFWGPAWPDEGPHTVDMWRKTAIHRLFDIVPHSAEYLAERLRVTAAVEKTPLPAGIDRKQIEAGEAADAVDAVTGEVVDAEFVPDDEEPDQAPQRPQQVTARIIAVFREHGLGAANHSPARKAIATGIHFARLQEPVVDWVNPQELTGEDADAIAAFCDGLRDIPGTDTEHPISTKAQLLEYAAKVRDMIEQPQGSE